MEFRSGTFAAPWEPLPSDQAGLSRLRSNVSSLPDIYCTALFFMLLRTLVEPMKYFFNWRTAASPRFI